jgi:hypothetical protein
MPNFHDPNRKPKKPAKQEEPMIKRYGNAVERAKLVPAKIKKQCKTLFMSGMDLDQISKYLSVEVDVLRYWVLGTNGRGDRQGTWYYIKEHNTDSVIDLFIKRKYDQLEKTAGLALSLVQDGLFTIKDEVETGIKKLTVGEIKSIAEVIGMLDKVARLESGQATEIINRTGLTPEQARKVLKDDPLAFGIIPVDAKVKEDDSGKEKDSGGSAATSGSDSGESV